MRSVDELKIEATITNGKAPVGVVVEWSTGTGPQALRPLCTCGGSGVCEHIVAALEAVRTQSDEMLAAPAAENGVAEAAEYGWIPAPVAEATQMRARSMWVVISSSDGKTMTGTLFLDTPRLRGVIRDAAAIVTMMDSTPPDDWESADRTLLRDEAVLEAFGQRQVGTPTGTVTTALARAFFALARHPRVRFDDNPASNRHPSELPPFAVDVRGLRLRAARERDRFVPRLETFDGDRLSPSGGLLLDGPPAWLALNHTAYLLDGSFDPRKVIEAASGPPQGAALNGALPSPKAIMLAAPLLPAEERAALGVTDAQSPAIVATMRWGESALLARLALIDKATGATAPFAGVGSIARVGDHYVRFGSGVARNFARRFVDAGFVPRGGDAFALFGPDRAAAFLQETLTQWDDVEVRLDSALDALRRGETELDISVSARREEAEDRDWFALSVDVFVGSGEPLTPKEITALLAGNGRYAEVRGKLVDVARLREREALLTDLSDRRRTGLAALIALRDELHEAFGAIALPPEVEALRERLRAFEGIEAVEPPESLANTLRGYQRKGLDFLAYLASFGFGGILADDMGTGKTIQVISYLLWRKEHEGPAPSLVIAPTSVTHTWEHEISRFGPGLRTMRLSSGSERAARFDEIADHDVVITSYALARLDAQVLAQHRFRTLVLDEAQNAKNPSSQIAKVVRALHADHRLALTGTPVENSLRDLWAIFAFLEPGLLGTESSFRRRFELPIADGNEKAAVQLRSRLEPFVLRRTKEDVAKELPERTEIVVECDLSPTQLRLYRGVAEAARRDVVAHFEEGSGEGASVHVLAALTRLRQICAHPGLIVPAHLEDPEASGKFETFLEMVEEIVSAGHRVLVFSAFASMLRVMRKSLEERGMTYGYLDGSTKDRDRRDEVERFMREDGPPLFLCSLKAGGVGLTLTAADYVMLYDPWWNPAVERQAIDRTHRIGQHRAVTAYRLVTRGTVEEKIRTLAERKNTLSRAVIKADSAVAKSLTREDLEMLFSDPE